MGKSSLTIVTHNCGGQSINDSDGNKKYCDERGTFKEDIHNIKCIEEPDLNITKKPKSLSIPADLWCLQEYINNKSKGLGAIIEKNNTILFTSDERELFIGQYYIQNNSNFYPVYIHNIHGRIISQSSSFNQIDTAISTLEKIVKITNELSNLIILGDFNFELMNLIFK